MMKKNLLLFVSALLLNCNFNASAQSETDYTVPSWTLYQRTVKSGNANAAVLVTKDYPYNVNVTVNGDPSRQFGAAWFTNAGVTGTKMQVKEGNTSDFTGAREISSTAVAVNDLMYVSTHNTNNNDLVEKTDFTKGTTRSYISNKALIDNLKPNTTYSYRVGGVNNAWSETGTFTTAKVNKDEFEFIYITDTQSNDDAMFEVSRKTVARARQDVPGAKFILVAGDLVETAGASNSEWEWEQWFETMKATWQKLPIVPIQGNHDTSPNNNMSHHFNTDTLFNAAQTDSKAKTAMNGTVYSFVYGDALFMIINYEDYGTVSNPNTAYFDAIEKWMEQQVNAHKDVKWKIVAYHKTMFTGSNSHQSDDDGRIVRKRMAKVFQRLGVNLALQGHDHIYEVIGVLTTDNETYGLTPKAVSGQKKTEGGSREDMTGIHGGTYNVSEGVLYFLNNSAGKKKYEPRTEVQMNNAIAKTEIDNYYTFFNRFGQTGEPTFSRITISTDAIKIATYTVNDAGDAILFDDFSVVRRSEADYTVPSWTLYQRALVEGTDEAEAAQILIPKDYPYNVNVTVNGDPSRQFGAAWFTNAGVTGTKIQVKPGDNVTDFAGATEIAATSVAIDDLVYIANSNNNTEIANASGFAKGEKRSYTSNKALITNLQPNTTYSYRVGKDGAWSETGTFTTAKTSKDAFNFIYITDTQANTDDMFDVSKKTVEAARKMLPDAKFLICTGDFVETYHIPGYEAAGYSGSAEWEWEQWFEKMQSTWLHLPIVPVQGNHDISPTSNMYHHFNTDKSYNTAQSVPAAKTNMDGTVYSFVYGDALFMVINFENIPLPYRAGDDNDTYINAIAGWLRAEVAAHTNVKWKIVAYHKSMFTGSSSHQDDLDGRFVREKIAPVLQELGIDLALQGHDHIYEVIGVLAASNSNDGNTVYTHLPNTVKNQESINPTPADGKTISTSVTGKEGGIYDVSEGVLYFLNNSAGKKKYYPKSEEQMTESIQVHGVANYFTLFNKFGQTGEPTFSSVTVSTDTISIATYTVNEAGVPTLFDAFKIVKGSITGIKKVVSNSGKLTVYPNPASNSITVESQQKIENIRVFSVTGKEIISQKDKNTVDLSGVSAGMYILSAQTPDGIYTEQFIVKK